ncbi:glycine/betaine ABC transporter [Coraliomargarita sinensis]|uniref:Glycine/betaine ABC transporter n=1 Tax=Coraliomargarita sinensis TaxID=2174842 RepID=A0A317ZJ35_9BACT|nr:glycine betaine ABC transporter substrate-binding protein [Coraliomargarita sinensis]PXA03789.1 glycine/betaine ABC transporter [Coraliomargarita sinensis]
MKTTIAILFSLTLGIATGYAQTLKIASPDWDEALALSQLAANLLEEEFGYTVEVNRLGASASFKAVASGEQDLFLNAWLPFTHADYYKEYGVRCERLGTAYRRAETGLAVPTYTKVRRIAMLNKHTDEFGGTITGIEADAGMTQKTKEVIKLYGLNYKIDSSSTAQMLKSVEEAIQNKEPILFHAWKPHWMFAKYDIKMLSDDNRIFQKEGIRKLARPGFKKDHKKAAQMLEKIALTEKQFNNLLLTIHESQKDRKAAVQQWIEANPKLVKIWTKRGFSLF